MAKKADAASVNTSALEAAIAQIRKDFGEGAIMRLGEGEATKNIEVIPTGSFGLDMALGVWGLPRGERGGLRRLVSLSPTRHL